MAHALYEHMTQQHYCTGIKINLSLHITGRRADGFHELSGLTTFCPDIGDRLMYTPVNEAAQADQLTLTGPFAKALGGHDPLDNLVLRAVSLLRGRRDDLPFLHIKLEKNIPLSSGIGGGSCDAAAILRMLVRDYNIPIDDALRKDALKLGADAPVCLAGRPCLMSGIGDHLDFIDELPQWHIVLANPLVQLSAGRVYKTYQSAGQPFSQPLDIPQTLSDTQWEKVLLAQRNDLQAPAQSLCSDITALLDEMQACEGAALARMSGSGATCFALFRKENEAQDALQRLQNIFPSYWLKRGKTGRLHDI